MNINLKVWEISENDFPSNGTLFEKFKFFINYAILAPSGHNTQPWLFKINDDNIEVIADRTRALPVIDPDDKELIISCGAAIENMSIAMKYFGFKPEIFLMPDSGDNDLLARVKITIGYTPTEEEKKFFKAITKRRTNRRPFAEQMIDEILLNDFENLAMKEHTNFVIIKDEDTKKEILKLIEKGDRIQCENKSFCRELAQWIHPNRTNSKDGIPGYAYGMNDLLSYAQPFFIGNLEWGSIQAGRDRNLVKGSPLLTVLECNEDNQTDWLYTGMSLTEILLKACSEGIAASYLNQPIEVNELNLEIRKLLGLKGIPQLIFRMGYGKEVKPTPRRKVEEVILNFTENNADEEEE
jgi:nitroreductase